MSIRMLLQSSNAGLVVAHPVHSSVCKVQASNPTKCSCVYSENHSHSFHITARKSWCRKQYHKLAGSCKTSQYVIHSFIHSFTKLPFSTLLANDLRLNKTKTLWNLWCWCTNKVGKTQNSVIIMFCCQWWKIIFPVKAVFFNWSPENL